MDYVTLSYVLAFIYVNTFIVMFFLWVKNQKTDGLYIWLWSSIVGIIAFLSVLLKPLIGDYTAFINNSAILIGFMLVIEGSLQFRNIGVKSKRVKYWVFLALVALTISIVNVKNPTNRYLMYDIFLSGLLILLPFVLLFKQKRNLTLYLLPSIFSILLASSHMYRWYLALTGVIRDYDGTHPILGYLYFAGITFSVTWVVSVLLIIQQLQNDRLSFLANYDSMTKLLNRRSFEKDLNKLVIDNSIPFKLSILDVDRFKEINDTHGHKTGDYVLKQISVTLSLLFPDDKVYRIGGDEFAIITNSLSENEIYTKIKSHLCKKITIEDKEINLSVSIGVTGSKENLNSDETYILADSKMYIEKKNRDLKYKNKKPNLQ